MGNETSKVEVVEPPPEWDPTSNAKKFELVSPMSDLSDPSMFLHRRPHPKLSDATVQQIINADDANREKQNTRIAREPPARLASNNNNNNNPNSNNNRKGVRQTPAGDRRRKSKVIATRDSAYKHQPRPRELPPPSAFYFPTAPTRESEENLNLLSVRKSASTTNNKANNDSNNKNKNLQIDTFQQQEKENQYHDSNSTPLLQKAKRNVTKARDCLTGCFEESNHRMQLMKDNDFGNHHQRLSSEMGRVEANHNVLAVESSSNKIDDQGHASSSKNDRNNKNNDKTKTKEKAPFDPYKEDPLEPTEPKQSKVLQFVDGKGMEYAFNPVWRESHEGTYHTTSTSTGIGGRESNTTTETNINKKKNSVGQFEETTKKRVSDPPSQMQESCDTENNDPSPVGAADKVPNPAGGRNFATETTRTNNQTNTNDDAMMRQESCSSVATSHESTYWNDYYKEAAQVLHHEDSYFDRIAYIKARQSSSSSMPEPSPMASGNSTATPVMDLFGQKKQRNKSTKTNSLLGRMSASPGIADDESQDELLPKKATNKNEYGINYGKKLQQELVTEVNDDKSKIHYPTTNAPAATRNNTVVSMLASGKGNEKKHQLVDLDITPKSSIVDTTVDENDNVENIDEQPSDEELVVHELKKSTSHESDRPMDEPPTYSSNNKEFDDFQNGSVDDNEGSVANKRVSFLDRRITADEVLVQTKVIAKVANHQSKRASTSAIIAPRVPEVTPKPALVQQRESFGSAYSYKDKDVFTPVTSTTTYPNGSPFRPRLNVPEQAMAKAKLTQPAMYTQSFDNMSRRSSGDSRNMNIYATESAPSMIETQDYRDIAYGCFLEDTPGTTANKKEQLLARQSPSVMSLESPMSTISPSQPMLTDQVMNNAAFLFSPSYASGGNSLLTAPQTDDNKTKENESKLALLPQNVEQGAKRQSTISISTLGSRSRISTRSQHVIRIPASRGRSSIETKAKSSMSGGSSQQKTVRFSDASVAGSDAGSQKSQRSVTWGFSFKSAPEDVSIPAIETKVSDLSDTVFSARESLENSDSNRESVDSIKKCAPNSIIEEEDTDSLTASETISGPSFASTKMTIEDSQSALEAENGGTPEQYTRTWTYCEFSKGVTPMLAKKQLTKATNSPVLRFKAAKNKFVGKQEKVVPVKKSSPCLYKKATRKGRVHMLASKFDNTSFEAPKSLLATNPTKATAEGDRPMLRTPQILGYKPKTAPPNIFQLSSFDSDISSYNNNKVTSGNTQTKLFGRQFAGPSIQRPAVVTRTFVQEAPFDEIPDDASVSDDDSQSQGTYESNDDESTFVQSIATVRQEGREEHNRTKTHVIEKEEEDRLDQVLDEILESESTKSTASVVKDHDTEDLPCDEAEDDLAEKLLNNILGASNSMDSNDSKRREGENITTISQQLRSVVSDDEEDDFSEIIKGVPSFSDESTTLTTLMNETSTIPKLRQGGVNIVKPHIQKQHQHAASQPTDVPASSLFLSPNMRTPMQASRWRQLAEKAQKEDSKKNIFRSAKKKKSKGISSGLSERNPNIA